MLAFLLSIARVLEMQLPSLNVGNTGNECRKHRQQLTLQPNRFFVLLTARNITDMVFHMKTTLNIDENVMARLKRESVRTGRTMSELVETALRRLLQAKRDPAQLPPLPSFRSGGALVDIADREALYRAMEGR